MKIVLSLCIVCLLVAGLLHILPINSTLANKATMVTATSCQDIPANPNYLVTERSTDAIAALNNAHNIEHVPALNLPTNFYQLDPIQQQFLLLNQERTIRGLAPLTLDANLSQIARGYSQQLRDLHFFSHTSPIAGAFNTRINSNPLVLNHYSLAAENLAGNPVAGIGPIYEYMYHDAAEVCGHRQNILDPQVQFVGIGLVYGSDYGSISAQEFLASAPWNPYTSTPLANSTPRISISVREQRNHGMLSLQAFTIGTIGSIHISWFLDNANEPQYYGPVWSLNMLHLTSGEHFIRAYVVDGEQHYGVSEEDVVL